MKKVFKFVKGRRDDKKDGGITPSSSGDLLSPLQTPEDERFLGLENATGYIVDFCGKDKSLTKLHKAAWQGNLEKVKNALKKIDIDVVDRHNRTALHFAVAQGHPDIVWFLLGNNARNYICDDEGRTPLLKAVECGHKECMNLLIERGANINHADFSGTTCLHIVTNQRAVEVATILLDKGADVELANNCGEYPLHIAIRTHNKDMVQLLLTKGASVNSVDRENRTPLMLAAKTGNLIFAQLFIEYGAQLNVVDSNGWTAEVYALLGGHQSVALELKSLQKKDVKPTLETHAEEDEAEAVKSDADTWNDSNLSDLGKAETGKVGQFLRKFSVESDGGTKSEKDDDIVDSPGLGIVPPPCQPPRSWEIIESGMLDEAVVDGAEPKRRSITALGSLLSRRESFTDNSGSHSDCPKYTLSLNRRKDSKKNIDMKQRFSFNEEETMKSYLSDDFSISKKDERDEVQIIMRQKRREQKERKNRSSSGSDWDSNLSSLLESESAHTSKKPLSIPLKSISKSQDDDGELIDGTLGRRETMNEIDEIWVVNPQKPLKDLPPPKLPEKVEEETEVSSSWDSGDSFQNEGGFPPPPTAFELGVDMAKSISYMKGISIDHTPGSINESNEWQSSFPHPQSHSLDCLDEKDVNEVEQISDKSASSKRHSRQLSIANQKWRSVELPPQQRPPNRLVDVNRRINEQLECYDQALRELAECSYAKRQDAIVSRLTNSSKTENYYSLPSVKCKSDAMFTVSKPFDGNIDYGLSLPLQFSKKPDFLSRGTKLMDVNSGPSSLPYSANTTVEQSRKLEEMENNEKLGFEDAQVTSVKEGLPLFGSRSTVGSPNSDDKGDKKGKRHMLLTMRDVKHAVQVTNSFKTSLDDQILSPLTKIEGEFNLSPKVEIQESEDINDDQAFFRGESDGHIERQETVIERPEFRTRSTSSESGDEPTLWLQEKATKEGDSDATSEDEDKRSEIHRHENFSPLGEIHREITAERLSKSRTSSPETSRASLRKSPVAGLKRFQRLDSSSENDESMRDDKGQDVVSPDASFSSGPIEPLAKDSGSEPESSHQDLTPVHNSSLKKHHKWLKDRLQSENKERHQLEEVAAKLAEKAERLQYELADAKEATKSRDEVITLLQSQLTRMEAAYTQSLEESVHCRLQLTALEQEILHLKELCGQYEDERETRIPGGKETHSTDLTTKIRQLEEEREGLSKVVIRLEKENRVLEKCLSQAKNEEALEERHRWKERCSDGVQITSSQLIESSHTSKSEKHNPLTARNCQLETEINLVNEINRQLENRLDSLIASRKLSSHEEINESILILNKKNSELENQLKILVEELDIKKNVRENGAECIADKLNKGKQSALLTDHRLREPNNEIEIVTIKQENKVLNKTIENLREEIYRLKQPNEKPIIRLNKQDEILSEKEMHISDEKETAEAQIHIEPLQVTVVPSEVDGLRKDLMVIKAELEETKKGNAALECQMKSLKSDGLFDNAQSRVAREDELAWGSLYGMKHTPSSRNKPVQQLDKDSEEFIEFKVKELEKELEKTKEVIIRQQIETSLRMQNIPSLAQNSKVLELKNKILTLESEIEIGNGARSTLEKKTVEQELGLREKQRLEFELEILKSKVNRDFVSRPESELAAMQACLMFKRIPATNTPFVIDEDMKRKCSVLAKERERANQLRKRLGRHCNSLEEESETLNNDSAFSSLPRAKTTIIVPMSRKELDEESKAELSIRLDSSLKKYGLDLPEDSQVGTLRIELLKKKYLC